MVSHDCYEECTGDSGRHPETPWSARTAQGTFAELDTGGDALVHMQRLPSNNQAVHVLPRVASGVSTGVQV
jgi:hypothetical protein